MGSGVGQDHREVARVYSLAVGQVAQLVEQRTENPRVGGSIPPLATILQFLSVQTTGPAVAMQKFFSSGQIGATSPMFGSPRQMMSRGLAIEAETLEGLSEKLERLVPDLLTELNFHGRESHP